MVNKFATPVNAPVSTASIDQACFDPATATIPA
jgi:hypothetical protein